MNTTYNNMILVEMESADKDKINNCELIGGLENKCYFFKVTYLRNKQMLVKEVIEAWLLYAPCT